MLSEAGKRDPERGPSMTNQRGDVQSNNQGVFKRGSDGDREEKTLFSCEGGKLPREAEHETEEHGRMRDYIKCIIIFLWAMAANTLTASLQ